MKFKWFLLGDEIVLCPGVYTKERLPEDELLGYSRPFQVTVPCHIVGCNFNRNYSANPEWNHPNDVSNATSRAFGNIVIRGETVTALEWLTNGGSIRNVDIHYNNPDQRAYFFGFKSEKIYV